MRRYELTDRGKFYIAVLLIFILVVVLVITLVSWASSREAAQIDSIGSPDGIIQNGDNLPSSGTILDADPGDEPKLPENSDPEQYLTNPDQPLTDPGTFDLYAGTMTFYYTLDMQASIDDYIKGLIGELLTSPKNNEDSFISVEIPQLSDDDTIILTSAIIDVLSGFDVPLSDIVFFIVSMETIDNEGFLVKLSFI